MSERRRRIDLVIEMSLTRCNSSQNIAFSKLIACLRWVSHTSAVGSIRLWRQDFLRMYLQSWLKFGAAQVAQPVGNIRGLFSLRDIRRISKCSKQSLKRSFNSSQMTPSPFTLPLPLGVSDKLCLSTTAELS